MSVKTWKQLAGLALAVVSVVATIALLPTKAPPQIITLPNGDKYQFVAAIWGTNEIQPSWTAHLFARLPTSFANYVQLKLGNRLGWDMPLRRPAPPFVGTGIGSAIPPEASLHFWFRSLGTNISATTRSFKFMLADQNGVISGGANASLLIFGSGKYKWLTFGFPAAPRRSATLQLCLFQGVGPARRGPYSEIGGVRIANPLYGHFPQWQPEPLPITKTAGDLQARLTDFTVASQNVSKTLFHPPALGEDRLIVFKLEMNSPRGTNEIWIIDRAELGDATGNRAVAHWCTRYASGEYGFMPDSGSALWPDEAAWRLKLNLKRTRGRDPEEVVTFKNVPLPPIGATNVVLVTNIIHGVPIVLKQEFRRQANTPALNLPDGSETRITVELTSHPAGVGLDFVGMVANTGWSLPAYSERQSDFLNEIRLNFIPTDATTVDITWAVQRLRTVEFLVKPP